MKIKRTFTALTAFIITAAALLIGSPTALAAAYSTDIRVLLSVENTKSLDIEIIGDYSIKEDPSFEFGSDEMTVSIVGSRPVLTSGDNTFSASSITLLSGDYDGTSAYIRLVNSKYGVCTYLGNMTFDVNGGYLRLINTLPTEHYLYGVVPYEMSNSFPVEALKAQAVCARGYAVANCSKFRQRPYDIVDTSADQVYHGYASRNTRAITAVDETFGQILTYEGDIIQAYYSASNGGQTELTGNVWPNHLPYYVHKDDIYDVKNPYSLEEMSFIPGEFNEKTLALMDPVVLEMLQTGADKAAGEQVTLAGTVLIKARSAIYDPPSRSYTKADVVLIVKCSDGRQGQVKFTVSLDDLVYSEDNLQGIFNTGKRSMRMRGAEPGTLNDGGIDYDGWFLTNRRWGHGVGLSQRGAEQRAYEGQYYSEMLAFYYDGTQICTIGTFDTAPALSSETYDISETGISNIPIGTTAGEVLAGISSQQGSLMVISATGAEKTGTVSTGYFVRTVYGDGSSYFDLAIILFGDIDGNGRITDTDLDALRQHMLGVHRLSGVYLAAADVNHDDEVNSLDVLTLIKHIKGDLNIEQ